MKLYLSQHVATPLHFNKLVLGSQRRHLRTTKVYRPIHEVRNAEAPGKNQPSSLYSTQNFLRLSWAYMERIENRDILGRKLIYDAICI